MKSRLQICRCTLSGSTPTPTSLMFEAMVNPTGYDIKDVTEFGDFKPAKGGTLPGMVKLRKPATFSIKDLVLDGTGVLTSGVAVEVKDLVGQLYKVAYDFEEQTNGDAKVYVAPVVQLQWGKILGFFRTRGISVSYPLFKPDGSPLRAKIGLELDVFSMPEKTAQAMTFVDEDYFTTARSKNLTSFRNP